LTFTTVLLRAVYLKAVHCSCGMTGVAYPGVDVNYKRSTCFFESIIMIACTLVIDMKLKLLF